MNLDQIKARCTEDGDCLLWNGSTDVGGRPKLSVKKAGEKCKTLQPRRLVWEQAKGPIPKGKFVTVTCGNPGCLAEEHLELITKGEVIRRTAKKPDVQRRRHLAGLKSRERSPLTLEQVRYIRECNKTLAAVAEELGIGATTASAIRRHKRWKEYAGNPFAGLIA
jgi:hypothetical protein